MAAAQLGLSFVIGGAMSFVVGYFLWVVQRNQRALSYEILTASIILPRLRKPTPDIQIMVRESLLTVGGSSDLVPVSEEILGFRIRLRNTGNQVIEQQLVTFTFDREARILAIEPESVPDFGGLTTATHAQTSSTGSATATIPFLNPNQRAVISLQCVGDRRTRCTVSAGAPGLEFERERSRRAQRLAVIGLMLLAFLIPPVTLRVLLEQGAIGQRVEGAITGYFGVGLMVAGFSSLSGIVALISSLADPKAGAT